MSNSAHMNGGAPGSASTDPHRRTFRAGYGGGSGAAGGMYRATTLTGTQKRGTTWDSSQNQLHQQSYMMNSRPILSSMNTATATAVDPDSTAMATLSLHNGNGHHFPKRERSPKWSDERPKERDTIEICSSPLLTQCNKSLKSRANTITSSSEIGRAHV